MTITDQRPTTSLSSRVRSLPTYSGVAVLWILVVAWASFATPGFASADNMRNILVTSAVPFVLAIGVTLTVLLGGIDLSVGSLLALSGVVLAMLTGVMPGWLAIMVAIAIAMAIALGTNGLLIGKWGINPFVITLGGLSAFRGIAYLISDGETKTVSDPAVELFGFGDVLGIPVPVIVMATLFVISALILRSTYFGRNIYAIGGNREAARISGIPIPRVTVAVYVFSGFCAGLAGVLQTGRSGAAAPTAAAGIELLVAAAVLLGGTRLTGGAGTVTGTAIAVLFLATIDNVLTLNGVTSYWQLVVVGVLLIAAVTIDRFRTKSA